MNLKARVFNIAFKYFVWALWKSGIRDRLRCPQCEKVGTYKPHCIIHHGEEKREDLRPRWMCKWCGYYYDYVSGKQRAVIADKPMWELLDDVKAREPNATDEELNQLCWTPMIVYRRGWDSVRQETGRYPDPWFG